MPRVLWESILDSKVDKSQISYLPKDTYCGVFGNELTMQNYQSYFDQLPWKDVFNGRGVKTYKTCWMVNTESCNCVYKYGKQSIPPAKFDDTISSLTSKVMQLCNYEEDHFNSCNLNAYLEADQYVEWHADNEALFIKTQFDRNVDIVSLSMGGQRNMVFRKKMGDIVAEISLSDGDLCFMGGRLQDHFQHHIPKWTQEKCGPFAPRVNLTWRTIKRHCKGCPLRASN
jgi:alkylated DNA repair dioxygenase AlkB